MQPHVSFLSFFLVNWVTFFAICKPIFYLCVYLFLSGHLGDLVCNMSTHVFFVFFFWSVVWLVLQYGNPCFICLFYFISFFFFCLVSWVNCFAIYQPMFYLFLFVFVFSGQLVTWFAICRPMFYIYFCLVSWVTCFAICQPMFYLFIYLFICKQLFSFKNDHLLTFITNNLHTVIWLQVFLSNTNNQQLITWFCITNKVQNHCNLVSTLNYWAIVLM